MHRAVDAFLAEIRAAPEIVAAAAKDQLPFDQIDHLQHTLEEMQRSDIGAVIEAYDRICVAVADRSCRIKPRLLAVQSVLSGLVRGVQ